MTRTEERLADALDAAARVLREDTLRPLIVPARRRRRATWASPLASAAALLIVVGAAVAVAGHLPGRLHGAATGPPRYYVEADFPGSPVVRSTVTGAVTARVPVPPVKNAPGSDAVGSDGNGSFFTVAYLPGGRAERIYRFSLTSSGKVTGFRVVPGAPLGGSQWEASAIAATADGSRVAIAFSWIVNMTCSSQGEPPCPMPGANPDYIDIIDVATGAKSVWQGGTGNPHVSFNIASLSWTADGSELVFLVQHCLAGAGPGPYNNETCEPLNANGPGSRTAEVRAIEPTAGGGSLGSARVLLSQSAAFPYIAQALVSPDGSAITAIVLIGRVRRTSDLPGELAVEQISVATRKRLSVLYRQNLGNYGTLNLAADFLALSSDGAQQHWLLFGGIVTPRYRNGFNGWIDGGRLQPVPDRGGIWNLATEAW